ncbi:hypothetical protein, partial [Salinimicrobium oceani]|uniref:hypothetical protein n=1 Tax=Salinimicrobium oceani TaxID=2722702 RepID=UPI001ADD87B9
FEDLCWVKDGNVLSSQLSVRSIVLCELLVISYGPLAFSAEICGISGKKYRLPVACCRSIVLTEML